METRYLISVGVNDYEIKPLDYCVKDSDDISSLMQEHCGVEKENIFNITSEHNKPNPDIYASIEIVYNKIKSKFNPSEDSIFFYYSGHGTKSGNSTALALPNRIIELQDLFEKFSELKPKFIFCLIDSCFSGVGIEDGIGKSANEYLFSQHVKTANGYNLICACASDSTAKEDENLSNGRLTRVFIDIVKNETNYTNGILNLSKVFNLIDEVFKNNPLFKQFPFAQTKGLSTYPLALLSDTNSQSTYSTHYIDDVETYDWKKVQNDLACYCLLKHGIIIEFTRLIRELLRNSSKWSKANFLKVEISKGLVSLYDNSGKHFDIFNPPPGTKINGGGTTARIFRDEFESEYTYSYELNGNETIQIFSFKNMNDSENPCEWKLESVFELLELQRGGTLSIPEECENFEIYLPHGGIDLSTTNTFFTNIIQAISNTSKKVIIYIDDEDRLKKEFINALEICNKSKQNNIEIR